MGTWNAGSFGNDTALDLLLRLEGRNRASVDQELHTSFSAYRGYDEKRKRKENTYVMTEERIEFLISQLDQSTQGSDEFFEGLRKGVGMTMTDYGDHEASEAIAAAEIVYAFATSNFHRVHADGSFLAELEHGSGDAILSEASECLASIKENKPLIRKMGVAWKRNLEAITKLLGQCRRDG